MRSLSKTYRPFWLGITLGSNPITVNTQYEISYTIGLEMTDIGLEMTDFELDKVTVEALPLVRSGTIPLIPDAWKELLDAGMCDEITIPVSTAHDSVVAKYYGRPVGFINFNRYVREGYLWIHLLYVIPSFRSRGVCGLLFRHLIETEKQKGELKKICGGITPQNRAAIEAAKSAGRIHTSSTYTYNL